jgi:hypothetical protein
VFVQCLFFKQGLNKCGKDGDIMRRRIIPLAALLIMALTISAQAIDLRAISVVPSLSFNGTTAVCYVDCWTGNSQDKVTATLTLYQDSTYVDSWNNSGKGGVFVTGSCEVESGKSYKLVLSYSINGAAKPSVPVTGTCP